MARVGAVPLTEHRRLAARSIDRNVGEHVAAANLTLHHASALALATAARWVARLGPVRLALGEKPNPNTAFKRRPDSPATPEAYYQMLSEAV